VTKDERALRKELRDLTTTVSAFLAALDKEMHRPGTPADRGPRLAKLANGLDMANDSALHFGLGKPFKSAKLNPKPLEKVKP
jgi:hypothetical protein